MKFLAGFHNYTELKDLLNSFSLCSVTLTDKLFLSCKLHDQQKRRRPSVKNFSWKFRKIQRMQTQETEFFCMLLVVHYILLVARYFLLLACYFLLVDRYFLFVAVTFCSLLVTICSLLVTFFSLLVTFCSLLVTFCLLLVTFCSLLFIFYSLLKKKFWRTFFFFFE